MGLCWFGFGEFVTLGRKPCSLPKDVKQLSGDARLVGGRLWDMLQEGTLF